MKTVPIHKYLGPILTSFLPAVVSEAQSTHDQPEEAVWKGQSGHEELLLLLLLTHGLVSFKLLYGLCRYALSAFVPPSVILNST
jgi:hypothetical protein